MIPRRYRNWVLVWTPVIWLVLEMMTYPKDRPAKSGFLHVMGGFVDQAVARYPAWVILLAALICLALGALGLARRAKSAHL